MGLVPRSLLTRKPKTHKGDYGHLLVVAGSVGFTGAPLLCAEAALLSGSGLVSLAVPKSAYTVIARRARPELMVHPMPDGGRGSLSAASYRKMLPLLERADVLAVGPGLRRTAGTGALVRRLLVQQRQPMVIDADGIAALKNLRSIQRKSGAGEVVLTPHPGEMAQLLGVTTQKVQKDRKKIALQAAKGWGVIVVLKGDQTVIASPSGQLRVNSSGNPGMATAGTGDLLTGIIAALMGQDLEPFVAASVAVYLHGAAGDLAAKEVGQVSLTASDLLQQIPAVFRQAADRQNLLPT